MHQRKKEKHKPVPWQARGESERGREREIDEICRDGHSIASKTQTLLCRTTYLITQIHQHFHLVFVCFLTDAYTISCHPSLLLLLFFFLFFFVGRVCVLYPCPSLHHPNISFGSGVMKFILRYKYILYSTALVHL